MTSTLSSIHLVRDVVTYMAVDHRFAARFLFTSVLLGCLVAPRTYVFHGVAAVSFGVPVAVPLLFRCLGARGRLGARFCGGCRGVGVGVCCCAGADVRGLVVCSSWGSSAWSLHGLVYGLVVLYDMIVNFGVYVTHWARC